MKWDIESMGEWESFWYDLLHPYEMLHRAYVELGKQAVIALVLMFVGMGLVTAIILTG